MKKIISAKKCLFLLTMMIFLFTLVGCNSPQRRDDYSAKVEPTKYSEKSYRVGETIEAGDYVAFATQGYSCKYKVTSDEYGFNLLREEYVGDFWTITLCNGEYVHLENCYLLKIEDTASYKSSNYDVSQYDGKEVRLKVGYHIPEGEYVFKIDGIINVFNNLFTVDENDDDFFLKDDFEIVNFPSSYEESDYVICSLYDGQYCEINGKFGDEYFLTLESTKESNQIKKSGMYKVGVHIPTGTYTFKSTYHYYSALDYSSYLGIVKVYRGQEMLFEERIEKDQTATIQLNEGDTVEFIHVEITHRDDLP